LQRRLAIARALMSEPAVLFADEPTAGLDEHDAIDVIAMLRAQSRERAVLLVTHNQRLAISAGGRAVLLAGGRVHERAATRAFFEEPGTDAGREFVRTGGCKIPSPSADAAALDETVRPPSLPPASLDARSRFVGPRGFFWVLPGRMGGLPRPGIVDDLVHDVSGLARLGVTVLVTLEETKTVDASALEAAGVRGVHFPIVDMGVPDVRDAAALCAWVERWMQDGEVVAFHCRAGLGRTGTMLAAQLVWAGQAPSTAIDTVRSINPRCIQSDAQIQFLREFAISLRGAAASVVDEVRRPGDTTTWH
jgi:atypical dual specificity phosphatase